MTDPVPSILMEWTDDGTLKPVGPRWAKMADRHYVIGDRYFVVLEHLRDMNRHRGYFAQVHNAWVNLREDIAPEYPNSEKLRKHALCRTGWCDSREFVASSDDEAVRLAAFLRPTDEYAIIAVNGSVVTMLTAKSQALNAMGGEMFKQSCQDVLGFLATLIGVRADQFEGD